MENTLTKYYRHEDIPEEIKESIAEKVAESPYRQQYHIEAPTGYLNDPNGFAYFDGKYHLFFQWSPYRYAEGIWYQGWYHLASEDLVDWDFIGPGIEPDTMFETHGAYSGSGLVVEDELLLFYTGNTRNEVGTRIPYQMIAAMNAQGQIEKREQAEITGPMVGYTDHFRDPKIWQDEDYYAVIGAQRENLTGAALVFHSNDTYDWQCLGEVETNLTDFGYMWECPDYFELDDRGVFIFSPQGIAPDGENYRNLYQTGYLIGEKIDQNNLALTCQPDFQELDKGFDFYAPQSMEAPDGRRILVAWMGLPELTYPTEAFAYCGCLTIPRELTIDNGVLLQKPVKELRNYRKNEQQLSKEELSQSVATKMAYEIVAEIKPCAQDFSLDLCCNEALGEFTRIFYKGETGELWLDRSCSGTEILGEVGGTTRLLATGIKEVYLNIFIDQSSIEIFINDGIAVASSRIFPTSKERFLSGQFADEQQAQLTMWDL